MHQIWPRLRLIVLAAAGAALCVVGGRAAAQVVLKAPESPADRVNAIFERWNRSDSPGCAVGVAERGKPVLTRAYGMANLDNGIRIRPDTVFESGSLAKQFTAFAIGLLADDGKLALSDPVRKFVPELPDFGTLITIQHLLNHTSGLRCQWPLLTLQGRPPGTALHTVAEVLELVSRQRELNFEPGDEYLYNNTAYVLLGVIVQRVSGQSLAQFSAERIFRPLGMNRTQWREDFSRIVEGRATAYRVLRDGTFRIYLPFTNVVGNGGLLTTVGDLLVWNEQLDNPRVGGRALVERLQTRGRLNDGFELEYAQGLVVTDFRGVREVGHNGTTAGYQTFLARYPAARLSVAVLCNTTGTDPSGLGRRVAEVYLEGRLKPEAVPKAIPVETAALEAVTGVYREVRTDAVVRISIDPTRKALAAGGAALVATAPDVYETATGGRTFTVERDAAGAIRGIRETNGHARPRTWSREAPFFPTADRLSEYVGTYYSDELDKSYLVTLAGPSLRVQFSPATHYVLVPAFRDAFEGEGNVLHFTRDAEGRVTGFRVFADRVRHLRFDRRSP